MEAEIILSNAEILSIMQEAISKKLGTTVRVVEQRSQGEEHSVRFKVVIAKDPPRPDYWRDR